MKQILLILIFAIYIATSQEPVYETFIYNNYKLPLNAANVPGGEFNNPTSLDGYFTIEKPPIIFYKQYPTERLQNFIPGYLLNPKNFAFEFWLLNHVDTQIGFAIFIRNSSTVPFTIGYFNNTIYINSKNEEEKYEKEINLDSVAIKNVGGKKNLDLSYKSWNYQFFIVYHNGEIEIRINNIKIFSDKIDFKLQIDNNSQVELAAYLENEPFMDLPNLIRYFSYYNTTIKNETIFNQFEKFKNIIDRGVLHPTKFHFNAGPYLNYVTKNSVSIVWETNLEADYLIEYGTKLPLTQTKSVHSSNTDYYINEITLDNLSAGTKYFYNIKAISKNGEIIESGILTFGTAVEDTSPFTFIVIGDTEARPHINDQLAKLIWGERPNFLIIAGDLTDGGKQFHKFEWNFEYFQGMNQIISRIPVFPILGNGESDVYWYDKYHSLPGTGELYSFTYGNAEYFALNSNKKHLFKSSGEYYKWLDSALAASTAKWKFVYCHHAPYSSDEDDYGNTWKDTSTFGDLAIRNIIPLMDKHKVDMFFYGHLHSYERSFPIKNDKIDSNGTYYILSGGAGGNLENFSPTKSWFNQKAYRGYHYIKIDINDNNLQYFVYNINGNLIDTFSIIK